MDDLQRDILLNEIHYGLSDCIHLNTIKIYVGLCDTRDMHPITFWEEIDRTVANTQLLYERSSPDIAAEWAEFLFSETFFKGLST